LFNYKYGGLRVGRERILRDSKNMADGSYFIFLVSWREKEGGRIPKTISK
jgi:hypothetical protein